MTIMYMLLNGCNDKCMDNYCPMGNIYKPTSKTMLVSSNKNLYQIFMLDVLGYYGALLGL